MSIKRIYKEIDKLGKKKTLKVNNKLTALAFAFLVVGTTLAIYATTILLS